MRAMERLYDGYLKGSLKAKIIFDARQLDYSALDGEVSCDWTNLYPGAKEEVDKVNDPIPLGKGITILAFVDAAHARDEVTRRSVMGIMIFLNCTPVRWYTKRQATTVESSTYGSELVAARILATEMVMEMRLNLQSMGIPVRGASYMFGDNMSVITNTTLPSSCLKKKHNAIVGYHRIWEAIAAGIIKFIHVPGSRNIADVLTKPLGPQVHGRLVKQLLNGKPPVVPAQGEYQNGEDCEQCDATVTGTDPGTTEMMSVENGVVCHGDRVGVNSPL